MLANNQNALNDIFKKLQEESVSEEFYKKIVELAEGENELWQCL